jgi:hypothetical protein
MAREGSWDIGGIATTWFDVTADISGWTDRDYIPFPATPVPPPPVPPTPLPKGGAATGYVGGPPRYKQPYEEKWKHPFGPPREDDPLLSLRKQIDDYHRSEQPPPGDDDELRPSGDPVFAIVEVPVPVYYETKGRETFTVIEVPAESPPFETAYAPFPLPHVPDFQLPQSPAISEEQRLAILSASDSFLGMLEEGLPPVSPAPQSIKIPLWVWIASGALIMAAGIAIGVALSQPEPDVRVRVLPKANPVRRKRKPVKRRHR